MKGFIILLFLLFIPAVGAKFTRVGKISVKGDFFVTDALQNFYIINGQELTKYDAKCNRQAFYSNNLLGSITSVNVTDPLRIMLFYKDFNQAVFLDRNLTSIGSPIVLDDLGAELTDVASSSSGGGFWLFNGQKRQLQYFDKNLNPVQQSISLDRLTDREETPNFLIENNDRIFLNLPGQGIYIFDRYGGFYKKAPVNGLTAFQVVDKDIIYFTAGKLRRYNFELLSESELILPDSLDILDARVEQNLLYLFKNKELTIYRMKDK